MITDQTAKPHQPKNRNPFLHAHQEALAAGQLGARTQLAMKWYKNFIRQYKNPISTQNMKSYLGDSASRGIVKVGHMYCYAYDAKGKDDLPFWDAAPMVFPFRDAGDKFYAINLHYAPPDARILIMYGLYNLLSDTKMNDQTRLRLSWKYLQRLSSHWLIAPLVHCYLKSHVRSQFIHIPVTDWQTAMFLPTQKWQKKSSSFVYREYSKKIGRTFQ